MISKNEEYENIAFSENRTECNIRLDRTMGAFHT